MIPDEINIERINDKYSDYLSVGTLRKILSNTSIPDDAKVLVERVEDVYYEKHGWEVYLKEGENTYKDENGNNVKESMDQFHPAWFAGGKDHLFIYLHY